MNVIQFQTSIFEICFRTVILLWLIDEVFVAFQCGVRITVKLLQSCQLCLERFFVFRLRYCKIRVKDVTCSLNALVALAFGNKQCGFVDERNFDRCFL